MVEQNKNIIIKLKAMKNGFNSAEKKLTDYILKNIDKVVLQTIRVLENESGVSYATIIRFTKKLGFTGFKDFKNSLIKTNSSNRKRNKFTTNFSILHSDKLNTILKKSFQNSFNILHETQQILDINIIKQATIALSKAQNILFIGIGDSGIIARYGFSRFNRIGLNCNYIEDSTLQKINTSLLTKNDILIAISSSGRSRQIVECAKLAFSQNINVITLCDYAISPLSKIASFPLFTTQRDVSQFLDIERPLTIAQIQIIELLFLNTCLKIGDKAFNYYQRTKEIADSEKI